MTGDDVAEGLELLRKIHGLLELLAEEKIAQRDAKQRAALRGIVGRSVPKQRSIFLMDGTRTQAEIRRATSVNTGHLSTLVSELDKAKLLGEDRKKPKLTIAIPANFFENHAEAD